MSDEPIGKSFPLGGPVPRDLIIGRQGEIEEITRRVSEGLSTMIVGERRIGKTTVCDAVCDHVGNGGALVVRIEVPERPDSRTLLQLMIDTCSRISLESAAAEAATLARPLIKKLLADAGLPLDLSGLGSATPAELPARAVLSLPIELARQQGRAGLVFLDELQRTASYSDGSELLSDLIDLYGGSEEVVLLVDGSEERAMGELFGPPIHFGKVVDRFDLPPTISPHVWRAPLTARFASCGLALPTSELDTLIAWAVGSPYKTMAASRYTALSARRTATTTISSFDVTNGIDEAERHLADDGV